MGGRILAVNEKFGYRPVLVVQSINRYPQRNATRGSTVLAGEQVLLPFAGQVGTSTPQNYQFNEWFANMIGVETVWNQMRPRIMETYDQYISDQRSPLTWLPIFPVGEATLKLIAAGNDPRWGYWLQFDGNIPLFSGEEWWVETDDDLWNYDNYLPQN